MSISKRKKIAAALLLAASVLVVGKIRKTSIRRFKVRPMNRRRNVLGHYASLIPTVLRKN